MLPLCSWQKTTDLAHASGLTGEETEVPEGSRFLTPGTFPSALRAVLSLDGQWGPLKRT